MAPPLLGLRLRWRRQGAEALIGASGLAVFLFVAFLSFRSWFSRSDLAVSPTAGNGGAGGDSTPIFVDLTLVHDAVSKGAVCLDGSAPGYHLHRGHGSGTNYWLLHIEGGGWCDSIESCSERARTQLGSSRYFERQLPFTGILSHVQSLNPDFYNWNKVKIRYCDGGSFSGNATSEDPEGSKLFFRGSLIWEAVITELLSKGLVNAKQALLTGCSAGGLATFIHCDGFRELLPKQARVKCLADAGFFLDEKDIYGNSTMRSFYDNVVQLQNVANTLREEFGSKTDPSEYFFPREIIKKAKTPLFILNPAYDFWQIQHILVPGYTDWLSCRKNIYDCDPSEIQSLQGYRTAMLDALNEFQHEEDAGLFVNSCFAHCQTTSSLTWHSQNSPRINNKTIAEVVGDWYFGRRLAKEVDCPYPCNPTCYNIVIP